MQDEKLVLDTNIWVSYFLGASTQKLVTATFNFDLQIFTTQQLIKEIEDVLQRPKIKKYLEASLKDCITLHEMLTKYQSIKSVVNEAPDPKDNFLFDLCLAAGAKILVTGDGPLLSLKNLHGIEIITWKDFKIATRQ